MTTMQAISAVRVALKVIPNPSVTPEMSPRSAPWASCRARPMPRTVPTNPTAGIAHAVKRTIDSCASRRSSSFSHSARTASAASCTLRVAPKRFSATIRARGNSISCSWRGRLSIGRP